MIADIAEARAHGDLSENAEYDAAKEQQGFIEGRISELEASLSVAEIIEPATMGANARVVFGADVVLYDYDQECEVRYQLVGELEADLEQGRISTASPLGSVLIGKSQGDEVEVQTPGGLKQFEVVSISYR